MISSSEACTPARSVASQIEASYPNPIMIWLPSACWNSVSRYPNGCPGRIAFWADGSPSAWMKILIPRDACPSAIPWSLPSDSGGSNSMAARAFSGTATTARPARTGSPALVSISTPSLARRTAATGVESRASNGACEAIASSSPRVPAASVTRPPVYWVSARL
jgi:hypothetical protein